jgi:hypothetical protein
MTNEPERDFNRSDDIGLNAFLFVQIWFMQLWTAEGRHGGCEHITAAC